MEPRRSVESFPENPNERKQSDVEENAKDLLREVIQSDKQLKDLHRSLLKIRGM